MANKRLFCGGYLPRKTYSSISRAVYAADKVAITDVDGAAVPLRYVIVPVDSKSMWSPVFVVSDPKEFWIARELTAKGFDVIC